MESSKLAAQKPTLFEFLSVEVDDRVLAVAAARATEPKESTRVRRVVAGSADGCGWAGTIETRTFADTYDDDPGVESIAVPTSCVDYTRKTAEDAETTDDDPGFSSLTWPGGLESTRVTENDEDTMDDDAGIGRMGIPVTVWDETLITKVEGETTDDDPGLIGLGFPSA